MFDGLSAGLTLRICRNAARHFVGDQRASDAVIGDRSSIGFGNETADFFCPTRLEVRIFNGVASDC